MRECAAKSNIILTKSKISVRTSTFLRSSVRSVRAKPLIAKGHAHYQAAYALNLISPFAKSTIPGVQTWIGFTR